MRQLRLFSLEKRRPRGISPICKNIKGKGATRTEPGSFQWCPVTQEVPSKHQGTLFSCKGDLALAEVTQRGGRVSTPRDIKKLPGRGPGQPAVGGPA